MPCCTKIVIARVPFGAFYSYFIVGSIFWARFIKIKQLFHLRFMDMTSLIANKARFVGMDIKQTLPERRETL